jgi:hypothetical protein
MHNTLGLHSKHYVDMFQWTPKAQKTKPEKHDTSTPVDTKKQKSTNQQFQLRHNFL